jgi:hypothetical protein
LITCLQQSIWSLKEDLQLLRTISEGGVEVSDEVAVLRAELAYTKTIFADFIRDAIRRDRPQDKR